MANQLTGCRWRIDTSPILRRDRAIQIDVFANELGGDSELQAFEPNLRNNSIRVTNVDRIICELRALECAAQAMKTTLKRSRRNQNPLLPLVAAGP